MSMPLFLNEQSTKTTILTHTKVANSYILFISLNIYLGMIPSVDIN